MGQNVIALLGQPNSGKSSLFNILTGSRQHVGNWPGKTVEQKEGEFTYKGEKYLVADFAGCKVPAMLLLNMMDVAGEQGIEVDADRLTEKLGIPVLPFVAVDKKVTIIFMKPWSWY
jgi:ferrous iron transport protein B